MTRLCFFFSLTSLLLASASGCKVEVHHHYDPQLIEVNHHHDDQKIDLRRPHRGTGDKENE